MKLACRHWRSNLLEYVETQDDDSAKFKIGEMLMVPISLEPTILIALAVCMDSLMTYLTVLPIRLVVSVFALLGRFLFVRGARGGGPISPYAVELLRGLIIAVSVVLLSRYDLSRTYHRIRAQSVVKLYVLYNVLEVADRLCSTVGVDLTHTLLYERRYYRGYMRPIPLLLSVITYVRKHSV